MKRQFGRLLVRIRKQVEQLSAQSIDRLSDRLGELESVRDLEDWISEQASDA